MPSSSIAAARGALYDLLVPALTPVQTTYGLPPTVETEEQEVVCMLGLEGPSEDVASLGSGNRREETYDIIVAVKVWKPDGTGRDVDSRAFTLVDLVRNTVLANRSLTQTVTWAQPVAARTDGPVPLQEGFIEIVELPIRCTARI